MDYRVIVIVGFHFLFTMVSSLSAEIIKGTVVKVVDGDTVTMVDDKGFKHRIRLAGIDAPEQGDQPYGKESTKGLRWLIHDKEITVEYSKHDRYGRIVGKILVGSKGNTFCLPIECVRTLDVGLEQIKAGMAWHYKRYQSEQSKEDKKTYSSAERVAKKKQVGLWGDKNPIQPWKWRRDNRLEALRKAFVEKGIKKKNMLKNLELMLNNLKVF